MLSCKEVVAHGDALLNGEVGLIKRIQIRIHLRAGIYCTRYLRQLDMLLRSFRRLYTPPSRDTVAGIMQAVRQQEPG